MDNTIHTAGATLGKVFHSVVGGNAFHFETALRAVYGDLVAEGLIHPDCGDDGIVIARIYQVTAHTASGQAIWTAAQQALCEWKASKP